MDAGDDAGAEDAGIVDGASVPGPLAWPQLTPGNDYVVPSLSLVTVTFTGYPYTATVQGLAASAFSSSWWAALAEYGVLGGQAAAPAVLDPSALWPDGGTAVTTPELESFLASQIVAGNLPAPTSASTTAFVVYVPNGFGAGSSCSNGVLAYHAQTTYTPSGGTPIPYELSVVNDCGDGPTRITQSASHQFELLATDPNLETGWLFRVPGYQQWQEIWWEHGAEIADFCQNRVLTEDWDGGPYTVERTWSNAAAARGGDPCVPSLPSDVYRNVYPDAPVKTAPPGGSVVFTLTGWSNVPTPAWPLVESDSYQAWFYSTALSSDTIGDGTTVTLTMTVPTNAVPGQFGGALVCSGPTDDPLCYPGKSPCTCTELGLQVVSPTDGGVLDAGTLDTDMLGYMQAANIPGMSVALIKNGQVILTRAYGYADLEAGAPMSVDSLFQLESVSKTVTGTALMQLEEQGRFQLDDDVNEWLSWTAENPYFPTSPVTFREVLTHTAGIDDGPQIDNKVVDGKDSPILLDTFMDGYLTPAGAYYGARHWDDVWPSGTFYVYTNAGAGLAGDLVERIAGEDLQTYCAANIFGPLGMTETSWFLADLTPAQQADIATPYSYYADGGLYADPLLGWPTYPDGQLRSSAPQLAQFLLAFANQGTLGAAQLVQPATASEMMTEQVGGVGEGLFWESLYEGQSGQYYVIGHGGLFTGYSTEMYFDPMTGAGYICLMNSDVGGLSLTAATSALANINNELVTVAEEAP